ncbi:hypothetical protein E8E15_004972 [Penicillium rubens]|mgnify:FL=1|jgi:hypothetical protein|uniref:uncharacterized protein n=1 Tax=Penicillium rubens TaxID=1108849 RepID=UPI001DD59077|nr:uncharacterized protein N7525_011425 [Penicillium rubens]KAF3015749.1 hypothetical protein E8E15_004972 [Penicillium rubens]KAJ5822141.1 hypothetical protein N7525_011425 [Penicillium rubens]KAJ5859784.1 hypothetical protein N7534_005061 [Penicillium rubens]
MPEENTHQVPTPTTDTYKRVIAAPTSTIEDDNGDCTLEIDGRDCTLEIDGRVEDNNKQAVNDDQTQVDESGSPDVMFSWRTSASLRGNVIFGVRVLLVVIGPRWFYCVALS